MEQPVLSDQERRWVDAVAKMTAMTYDGRLQWQKVSKTETPKGLLVAYGTSLPHPSFIQTFSLIVTTRADGTNRDVRFVTSQNGITVKVLDDLTIVQALADAVLSKTEDTGNEKEEATLSLIESS